MCLWVSGWCLDGVLECIGCINTNSVIKQIILGHHTQIFYSGALYCIKMPMSRGVWIVSEGVWIEYECVWGCINTKSVGKNV